MVDRLLWLVLAAGHLLPALSAVQPAILVRLYGLAPGGDLSLLMRHRGVLFAVMVIIACWAAVDPGVRSLALLALGVSIGGFLLLYIGAASPAALRQIAIVDAVLVPVLAAAAYRHISA
jgi:hypothetical protein